MKVALLTLGCKVNQAETVALESALAQKGFQIAGLDEGPDFCVINTCTVTAKSDYQSRQLIRKAARAGARVIVTGCYSELNQKAVKDMDGVVEVMSNKDKDSIINVLNSNSSESDLSFLSSPKTRKRAFLKIQDGCDHLCSYCLIRIARGRSISVEPGRVIEMVRNAAEEGHAEVVLTGIHLGLYGGLDAGIERAGLVSLLKRILKETGVRRIRLSSLQPNEIGEGLIELMQDKRICSHLHIPLQSGDDIILKRMKRPYNLNTFIKKIELIHRKISDIGIGTDIIAGFPGEDEACFSNTLAALRDMPFSYAHIFPYSERPGTAAADLDGKVPAGVKKERTAILREIAENKKISFIQSLTGKTLDVLIEGKASVNGKHGFKGTAGNYIKVFTAAQEGILAGNIEDIRVCGGYLDMALGVL
ncbi:MAG: tRNA (N(6)-L-threonylcarbamoyladenosine(37)-C(2))-methylthiotransferase MtaB [Nitrospiraceae bacterium]|nr:tRNA (N(6)-L-threonylcarbamoyladenosine(37)-C(2))-methylthiotransferase MtaB [Nitrospiraceae bacterium]